ncbi:MAG: maleylacetoacetate isomerase [Arenicella sp.]|jgi:maleylacetoacetate isomerase
MLKLSTYFRSTAAYRVRIALQLKGLPHELLPVHLMKDGGEHKTAAYLDKNPSGLVPILETEVRIITQSLAILEYLEEAYPEPSLLPGSAFDRAYIRSISQSIACDIHPLNNLRVLQYLTGELGLDEAAKNTWYQNWIAKGFSAIETNLASSGDTGLCCFGDTPSMADCCLIPQVYNAERFNCPMVAYPTIARITKHCLTLPTFIAAMPDKQPDYQ